MIGSLYTAESGNTLSTEGHTMNDKNPYKVVEIPAVPGGRASEPNPFVPAAEAAIQAQTLGKAIAFDLDLGEFKDVTTVKTVDGIETTTTKTATEQAVAYATRKIRELGAADKFDRTFTVIFTPAEEGKPGGTLTVAAKPRITRAKKTPDVATPEA